MIYCNGGMLAISDMDEADRFSFLPDWDLQPGATL